MNWIKNMKIMTKLVSVFIFISILSCIVGIFGIQNMLLMDKSAAVLYNENVLGISSISEVEGHYSDIRLSLRGIYMRDSFEAKLNDIAQAKVAIDSLSEHLNDYEKTITSDEDRNLFNEFKDSYGKYIGLVALVEKALNEKEPNNKILALTSQYIENGNKTTELIGKIKALNINQAKSSTETNTSYANKAILVMTTLVTFSVIFSIVLGILIALSISKPINELAKAGKKLSLGDINIDLKYHSKDEVGILTNAFKDVIESTKEQAAILQKIADGDMTVSIKIRSESDIINKKIDQMLKTNNGVFGEMKKAAEQVNSAAEQVAQGSTNLAQSSTEQSATVEEISSTVGEIASQSKENASGARNANELANEARASAEIGSSQMKSMMSSMEDINEASRSISKIIRVIDDIAFQTNILALNAAVEAARAGSHGKGFAVVAEEVRNLAARSAKAANETTDLIESTISKVNAGTKIASETASALNIINDKIGKVTLMIADIATSSGEQATAVAQVSLGMSQISEAVQTNSSTAEESAAASEELSAQATLLKESVARFRLKDGFHNYDYQESSEKTIKEGTINQLDYNSFGKY